MIYYMVLNTQKESISKAVVATKATFAGLKGGELSHSKKYLAVFTCLRLIPVFQKSSAVRNERPTEQ